MEVRGEALGRLDLWYALVRGGSDVLCIASGIAAVTASAGDVRMKLFVSLGEK